MGDNFLSIYFVVSLAYNAASLNSLLSGGVAFTTTDPLPASLALLMMWSALTLTRAGSTARAVMCVFVATALSIGGVATHIGNMELYHRAEAYHDTAWTVAVFLNAATVCMLVQQLVHCPAFQSRTFKGGILVWLGMLGVALAWRPPASALCTDTPFFSPPEPSSPHLPFQHTSQYVTMSDGVRLAVDVYLPAGSCHLDGRCTHTVRARALARVHAYAHASR